MPGSKGDLFSRWVSWRAEPLAGKCANWVANVLEQIRKVSPPSQVSCSSTQAHNTSAAERERNWCSRGPMSQKRKMNKYLLLLGIEISGVSPSPHHARRLFNQITLIECERLCVLLFVFIRYTPFPATVFSLPCVHVSSLWRRDWHPAHRWIKAWPIEDTNSNGSTRPALYLWLQLYLIKPKRSNDARVQQQMVVV